MLCAPQQQGSDSRGRLRGGANLVLLFVQVAQLDWLDPPDPMALRQAARQESRLIDPPPVRPNRHPLLRLQLFLVGAIDANGMLTSSGSTMARLPLEPVRNAAPSL